MRLRHGGKFVSVNLVDLLEITLRRLFPGRFTWNVTVVPSHAALDTEAADVLFEDAGTEIDVVFNLKEVNILPIGSPSPFQ